MNYDGFFEAAIARLWSERRYRFFADVERIASRFPRAIWHSPQGPREIVIWCSNDYLGMGQQPKVIGALVETATRMGAGAGGPETFPAPIMPLSSLNARSPTCTERKRRWCSHLATSRMRPASLP